LWVEAIKGGDQSLKIEFSLDFSRRCIETRWNDKGSKVAILAKKSVKEMRVRAKNTTHRKAKIRS